VQAKRCLIYEIDGELYTFGPPEFQEEFAKGLKNKKNPLPES
jgi:hypothetical protein